MGKIVILDENTANKIAAGEVAERPASVVKELVENSMDAGASNITIEIKNGGISYIKVMDNGSGMDEDDVEIAFERHATSKIRKADDLENILSMGFRGEALASIAAVSSVLLTTRTKEKQHGTSIEVMGGNIIDVKPSGCPVGTSITIRDLFYNTPARFKFLKKDSTEAGYISDILNRIALGNPQISFKFISNGSTVLHTPGNNDQLSAIFSIYGKDTANGVYSVNYEDNKIKVCGYAGKSEIARSNRNYQSVFINRRFIKSKVITSAIDEAYNTFLMKNKFAFIVLNIDINPMFVDVNVHPSKMEVKFSNEQDIFRAVFHAVSNTLLNQSQIRNMNITSTVKKPFVISGDTNGKIEYRQQTIKYGNVEEHNDIQNKIHTNIDENTSYDLKNDKICEQKFDISEGNQINSQIVKESIIQDYSRGNIESKVIEEPCCNIEKSENEFIPIDKLSIKETEFSSNNFKNNNEKNDIKTNDINIKEKSILSDAKIIGQAFSTYIILQQGDQLLLLDQHAAHERIMYEELKKRYNNNQSSQQMLLLSIIIDLTHQEIKFLEEEKEFFNKLGYTYECFGSGSIILRTAPFHEQGNLKEVFIEVLDTVIKKGGTSRNPIVDEVLYTIACKAAIKANKKLDDLEIKNLIEMIGALENPYTCPHGRPTILKLTKYDLEKMFKRIV